MKTRSMSHSQVVIGFAVIALLGISACGSSTTADSNGTTSTATPTATTAVATTDCTSSTNCPAATTTLTWTSSLLANKVMTIATGTTASVSLSGVSSSARTINTFFASYPTNATVTSGSTSTLSFCSTVANSGSIVGVARDMSRCLMMESASATCYLTTNTLDYDTRDTVTWTATTSGSTTSTTVLSALGNLITSLGTTTTTSTTTVSPLATFITALLGTSTTASTTCP